MGLKRLGPPRQSIRRRRLGGPKRSSSGYVPRCGMFVVVAVLVVITFEFLLMHGHKPGRPHFDSVAVDATTPHRQDTSVAPGATTVPKEPSLPDSPQAQSGGTAGTRTIAPPRKAAAPSGHEDDFVVHFDPPPRQQLPGLTDEGLSDYGDSEEGYGEMRVAVLVPYSGPGLPIWFDAFTDLAAASEDAVDWIIFCEEELAQVKTPRNVHMKTTSPSQLAWLLAGIVYPEDADEQPDVYVSDYTEAVTGNLNPQQQKTRKSRALAAKFIQKLLAKNPYYMVEFKPALGWVFRDYIKDYTHWAFGDLDVFFGDLTQGWLEPNEMREFDIVTYSFGDQHRAYLRGQLTVHKSIPKVNQVWRRCHHLSKYMARIQNTIETKRYDLESAEGCYSMAVMYSKNIKAKYAVKVFTDMPGGGLAQGTPEEVVITGDALVKRCPVQEQRRGDVIEPEYGRMQMDVGPRRPVEVSHGHEQCEYWITPEFQTCLILNDRSHQTNVFLDKGLFYERGFINLWEGKVGDNCRMGAFHHFQDFKGNYKAWNTRPPMPPVHRGMVAGSGGLVPLPNGDWRAMAVDPSTPSPENRDRFTHRYCMHWRVSLDRLTKPGFTCDVSVTPADSMITLYDTRPSDMLHGRLVGGPAVTLGGVGLKADLEGLFQSCREWEGPKIIVLLLGQLELDSVQTMLGVEARVEGSRGLENARVVAFTVPNDIMAELVHQEMPRKTLLNALGDLCQTRHLLTLAADFRLAKDAQAAVLAALRRRPEQPRVLVIPQWCVDPPDRASAAFLSSSEVPSRSLRDLRESERAGTAGLCHKRGGGLPGKKSWFGASTVEEVVGDGDNGEMGGGLRGAGARRRSAREDVKISQGVSLLMSDLVGPVIVVDLWSAPALFLRHMEELTRPGCFDGAYARGLWAAGFSFEVVPDAAAFSEALPSPRGCREGTSMPLEGYSVFLLDVRRVYFQEATSTRIDYFRSPTSGDAHLQSPKDLRRKSGRPFHRQQPPGGAENADQFAAFSDQEPDLEKF